MFLRIFTTRVKCIFRNRSLVFWTLLFPLILATMFHFAFASLNSDYEFKPIDIAVVNNDSYIADTAFKEAVESVSEKNSDSTQLFNVTYCTKEKAEQLLKDSIIKGYFNYEDAPSLIVKESSNEQSIMKTFLDEFEQKSDAYTQIIKANINDPAKCQQIMAENIDVDGLLKEVSTSGQEPNLTLNYYYALIAMACLFGGSLGMNEIIAIQANQSCQGARLNLAPVPKSKVFLASISAATVVQFGCMLVLLAALRFIFGIDFGTRIGFIILGALVASFTGVSFGAFIAAVIKFGEKVKTAILITSSLTFCFLSGLMVVEMKQIIEANAPILAAINPANAITDTFYSLYYYDTLDRFFADILGLLGFSAFFYLAVYLVMRRQRYESI